MTEQRRKEYLLAAVYGVGIVLGTTAALGMRDDLVGRVGIYQTYFQESLSEIQINAWDYFIYIMRQRFWSMGLLLMVSLTTFAYPCLCAFSLYYGFCMAGMVVAATASRGILGVLFFFLSVMPHYILYVTAVLLMAYVICHSNYFHRRQKIQSVVMAFLLFMTGVFAEVYWQPHIDEGDGRTLGRVIRIYFGFCGEIRRKKRQ